MSDEDLDRQQRTTPTGTSPEKPAIRPYRPAKLAAYLVLIALGVFSLVRFGWILLAAFDPNATIYFRVPATWTLQNFVNLFAEEEGLLLIVNSLVYTLGATAVLIVVITLAGYGLSRSRSRRRPRAMPGRGRHKGDDPQGQCPAQHRWALGAGPGGTPAHLALKRGCHRAVVRAPTVAHYSG
jgi:ABC-type Fe3+ transport system permease subunit